MKERACFATCLYIAVAFKIVVHLPKCENLHSFQPFFKECGQYLVILDSSRSSLVSEELKKFTTSFTLSKRFLTDWTEQDEEMLKLMAIAMSVDGFFV